MTAFSFGRSNGVNTVAAAGNASQANGTKLTAGVNAVTSSTAASADSVVLPSSWAVGDSVVVLNLSGVAGGAGAIVNVYPASGHAINTNAADAVITLADGEGAIFIRASSTTWGAIIGTAT